MLFSSAVYLSTLFWASVSALPTAERILPRAGTLSVETEGTGCPPGSFAATVASDNSAINIIFDNFAAGAGPNSAASGLKPISLCKVTISSSTPEWTVDVTNMDFRGFVGLDSGVDASLINQWKWIDNNGNDLKGSGSTTQNLRGPFNDDVEMHLQSTGASCLRRNAKIQLLFLVTLTARTSTANGIFYGSSEDFGFKSVANLQLKQC